METSTSYEIYWGTDLFISKFAITEFALFDTNGDSRRQIAFFFTHFYLLKRQKKKNHQINSLTAKIFNLL